MKKRGFTLVEIIVVIALIVFIGTVSFFGIRLVSKNIKISKLEQITDNVLRAAEIYIETNKETKTQLYNNKNSVIIPLNTLVNEGLLDLKGTTLEDKDIENEYVVTAYTKTSSKENCIDITSSASWNLSKDNPFYICSNESGSSNSIIIGGTSSNIDTVKVQDEVTESDGMYRFIGGDNFITYKNKTYRIILVDRDDSLVIGTTENTFGDVFNGKTQNYSTLSISGSNYFNKPSPSHINYSMGKYTSNLYKDSNCNDKLYNGSYTIYLEFYPRQYGSTDFTGPGFIHLVDSVVNKGEVPMVDTDFEYIGYKDTSKQKFYEGHLYHKYLDKCYAYEHWNSTDKISFSIINVTPSTGKKIKLKSCMKITGGTGTGVNPYELSDLC